MVWIDSVLDMTEKSAICSVTVDRRKHYCDENGVRPSALIEWMAQACAFSEAARGTKLKRAFLVGFSQFELKNPLLLQASNKFHIQVEKTRELPPLTLVHAKILSGSTEVASANLKLYGEV